MLKGYIKDLDSTSWCWFNKKINAVAQVLQCIFETTSKGTIRYDLVKHPKEQDVYYVSDFIKPLKGKGYNYNTEVVPYRLSPREG